MRSNPDSFGTFFEHLRRLESERPPQREQPAARDAVREIQRRILAAVVEGPANTRTLLGALAVDVVDFAEALKGLQDARLVELRSIADTDVETVHLTKLGQQLASVAD
jgi:hypothetical protein